MPQGFEDARRSPARKTLRHTKNPACREEIDAEMHNGKVATQGFRYKYPDSTIRSARRTTPARPCKICKRYDAGGIKKKSAAHGGWSDAQNARAQPQCRLKIFTVSIRTPSIIGVPRKVSSARRCGIGATASTARPAPRQLNFYLKPCSIFR